MPIFQLTGKSGRFCPKTSQIKITHYLQSVSLAFLSHHQNYRIVIK